MQWQELRSQIRHLPAKDIKKVESAFLLGKSVHEGQKRKSGEPYFNHPIAVAHMLIDLGADRDTIIAALLHDTVEDTPLTLGEIDKKFDGSVAVLIDGLTKLNAEDMAKSPQLNEQIETLRKMFTLMQQDIRIMVIKLIDRLHNMQTIEFLPMEKQKSLAMETLEVYAKIAERLCMQDVRDELEGLCYSVLDPALSLEVQALRERNEQRAIAIATDVTHAFMRYDSAFAQTISIGVEPKVWDQLSAQTRMGHTIATGLSFITLTFVCDSIDACYHTLGTLHQHWKREVLSFQDYINAPQLNGYKGLHTTVILQDGTRVRCKIRTKAMQTYARQGIASQCFNDTAGGIREYLPWVDRISSLTSDTKGSSTDFWENLKSDILGEFIIIHGPDDSTVQLPKKATALDAAFYLFHEHALRTKSIRMNGVEVLFGSPLVNAASIEVTLDPKETCELDWLKQVTTGLALATIREAFLDYPQEQKILIGKEMLQNIFSERKKGNIEEFSEKNILEKTAYLQIATLEEMYIAIADGKLKPQDVYTALLLPASISNSQSTTPFTVQYILPAAALHMHIHFLQERFGSNLVGIRYAHTTNKQVQLSIQIHIPPEEVRLLKQFLLHAGAESIFIRQQFNIRYFVAIFSLILLWGFDPVFSKIILSDGMQPIVFSFICIWSLFLFSTLLFVRTSAKQSFSRIPFYYPSLWIAGVALFLVNICTYFAIDSGSPVTYNTILRANAVILSAGILMKNGKIGIMFFSALLEIAACILLYQISDQRNGVLLSLLALLFFALYTAASLHFQEKAKIVARYPQFLFVASGIGAVLSLPMLVNDSFIFPSALQTFLISMYCAFFVGMPYYLFYVLTLRVGYSSLSYWMNALLVMTLLSYFSLFGFAYSVYYISAGLLAVIGNMLVIYFTKKEHDAYS